MHSPQVVQAEAADGLDPISALREQRRAAVRAQARGGSRSFWLLGVLVCMASASY